MPVYYDDNFGHWDNMDDPDMQRFYREVQKESIALLTTQLHNERLKNANLDSLARARTNSGGKTVED